MHSMKPGQTHEHGLPRQSRILFSILQCLRQSAVHEALIRTRTINHQPFGDTGCQYKQVSIAQLCNECKTTTRLCPFSVFCILEGIFLRVVLKLVSWCHSGPRTLKMHFQVPEFVLQCHCQTIFCIPCVNAQQVKAAPKRAPYCCTVAAAGAGAERLTCRTVATAGADAKVSPAVTLVTVAACQPDMSVYQDQMGRVVYIFCHSNSVNRANSVLPSPLQSSGQRQCLCCVCALFHLSLLQPLAIVCGRQRQCRGW